MNIILAIPLPLRLALLFVAGAVVAGFINLGVYRLAWRQRLISPWSPAPPGAPPRGWLDRVPISGWWLLARESQWHGRGFWIRPLLVELGTGLLFAWLYLFDVVDNSPRGLIVGVAPLVPDLLASDVPLVLHVKYLAHVLLVSLMLVATLIDLDEKTIPDAITVPGAILGLLLAALFPWMLPTADEWQIAGNRQIEFVTLCSPQPWDASLDGLPQTTGLAIAVCCWTLWCGGLMPRNWKMRRGLRTAVRVFLHRLRVEWMTYLMAVIWLAGCGAIAWTAWAAPHPRWVGLLSSLVGVLAGGGMVWLVRVLGALVLQREAMGFGDVTLMSMIGAFVGWQAAIMVFFLAPFFALAIAVLQWIANGDREIPYGPYLCLATFGLLIGWSEAWEFSRVYFSLGLMVPAVLAGCMVLLPVLLWLVRLAGRPFERAA